MLLPPPKNQWEPNLQHENSDAPSPSAGYNNHVALLGNRLAGEVDGKTIGCDDTGLFGRGEISIPPVPSKRAGPAYSTEDIPKIVHHGNFGYHLKNCNKRNVQFQCDNRQNKIKCNGTLFFAADATTNTVPMSNPTEGRPHNLNCCLKNGKLEDDPEYVYEGRTEDSIIQEVDEALAVSTDVSIEGEELVRKYSVAVDHITMVPSQIWDIVNKTLSAKCPTYHGVNRNSVLNAVQKHRKALGLGDDISTVTKHSSYFMLGDGTNRGFIHHYGCMPHPKTASENMEYIVLGHPSLLKYLRGTVHLLIDATFDCVPSMFYQCLILMIHDDRTDAYIPIAYVLMTHKFETLYDEVMHRLVILSEYKIKCLTYTTDFEHAIMNS